MFGGSGLFLNFLYLVKLNENWKVIRDHKRKRKLTIVAIDKAKGKGGILRPSKSTGPPIPPELVFPFCFVIDLEFPNISSQHPFIPCNTRSTDTIISIISILFPPPVRSFTLPTN